MITYRKKGDLKVTKHGQRNKRKVHLGEGDTTKTKRTVLPL